MGNDGPYKIHVSNGDFLIVRSSPQSVDAISIVLKSPPNSSLDFLCDLQQAMNTAFNAGRASIGTQLENENQSGKIKAYEMIDNAIAAHGSRLMAQLRKEDSKP